MFELQTINDNGEWEAYPDPLRDTEAEANEKMAYCLNYRETHNMGNKGMRVIKLDEAGIEKHNEEWKKWVSMID